MHWNFNMTTKQIGRSNGKHGISQHQVLTQSSQLIALFGLLLFLCSLWLSKSWNIGVNPCALSPFDSCHFQIFTHSCQRFRAFGHYPSLRMNVNLVHAHGSVRGLRHYVLARTNGLRNDNTLIKSEFCLECWCGRGPNSTIRPTFPHVHRNMFTSWGTDHHDQRREFSFTYGIASDSPVWQAVITFL